MKTDTAKVCEMITTISGEVGGVPVGTKIALVRFSGCNLRCNYCDSIGTQVADGMPVTVEHVVNSIEEMMDGTNVHHILFTGGEPLLYADFIDTVMSLLAVKHGPSISFSIETNGSVFPKEVMENLGCYRVTFVVDIKLDEWRKGDTYRDSVRDWYNFHVEFSSSFDTEPLVIFKIPVLTTADIHYGLTIIEQFDCGEIPNELQVFFSPIFAGNTPVSPTMIKALKQFIIDGKPFLDSQVACRNVRVGISVQVHKLLDFP